LREKAYEKRPQNAQNQKRAKNPNKNLDEEETATSTPCQEGVPQVVEIAEIVPYVFPA